MTKLIALASLAALVGTAAIQGLRAADEKKSPLDYKANSIDGKEVDLSQYKGKVALIVNVASQCGNTPQYAGLEKVYKKYKDQGLVVMGFPANEFGTRSQAATTEIVQFCKDNYSVDFPMFSKIVVKGDGIAPIYKHLTSRETNPEHAGDITWNFESSWSARDGQVVKRFKPKTGPESRRSRQGDRSRAGKEVVVHSIRQAQWRLAQASLLFFCAVPAATAWLVPCLALPGFRFQAALGHCPWLRAGHGTSHKKTAEQCTATHWCGTLGIA